MSQDPETPESPDSVRVAITQMAMLDSRADNLARACDLVREAAAQGAQVVLLPELFETRYFPRAIDDRFFELALPTEGHPAVRALSALCKALGVVVPVSLYERDGERRYNTVVMLDADGGELGRYRKSHIPSGSGYEEKHYFHPGDTGFRVWDTRYGRIGVGICWDQWFPECARAMVLQGAELLLYPTAIGSEPEHPGLDTRAPWRRVMVGHAVANTVPVAAANRIGDEGGQRFYGHSFVCDQFGELLTSMDEVEDGVRIVALDRAKIARDRAFMDLLPDRRPELYAPLTAPPRRS